ncbi:NADH-ubiquinone oxidoreductase chain F [hydrothermal vent metagenome]|uniref:NADH-ubiquinone oxidoreductase chain F n=1 Tax=hydrothermal vent metagenome TaxID=652676 RepID=A0A3B0VWM7_9ZZZZ
MSKNLTELSARNGLKHNLFEQLATTEADASEISKEFLIGTASVAGTVSFYDFLKDENKNKKIYICNGSACLCAGTQDKLSTQLTKYFNKSEIGHMTCLGRCHESSAFQFQDKNYSGLTSQQLDAVITSNQNNIAADTYHCGSIGKRVLTTDALEAEQFIHAFKEITQQKKQTLLVEIKRSSLRGRGGAGFPIGFKLEAAMNTTSAQKYIICNADEGDAGAYSDRYLLEQQPLLVLFGIMVSAYIVGANYGILYIRAEYPEAIKVIAKSINELKQLTDDMDFQFKIISAKGAYICGEETALINSIEGQRPEVRVRPPFPTAVGLFNKPTVVNNVETLASLYAILTKGGDFYNQLGTNQSKGTKLLSLDSFFHKPGIYEVEMGTPLVQVFEQLGGGFKQDIKAVQIGGPLGGIVPVKQFARLSIDFESFIDNGFLLGHASVVCIPKDFSMLKYLHHLFEFAAYESCGKCFPCRLGTKRGEELLTNAIKSAKPIDRQLFTDLLDTLEQGSLCAHGGGIPLPVRNVLKYFADELQQWFA